MYIIIGEVPMTEKVRSVQDRHKGEEVILVNPKIRKSEKLSIITREVFHYLYPKSKKISCRHYLPNCSKKDGGKLTLTREEVKIEIKPV